MIRTRITSLVPCGFLLFVAAINSYGVTFDFETTANGTSAPFTETVDGLSASFSGLASVCSLPPVFATLSGNVMIQSFCGSGLETGPVSITFSSNLSFLALNFATAGGLDIFTVAAFEGSTLAGSTSFLSALPPRRFSGEGIAFFEGTFDRVTLSNASTFLAIDNIEATPSEVPEPAAFALMAAGMSFLVGRRMLG